MRSSVSDLLGKFARKKATVPPPPPPAYYARAWGVPTEAWAATDQRTRTFRSQILSELRFGHSKLRRKCWRSPRRSHWRVQELMNKDIRPFCAGPAGVRQKHDPRGVLCRDKAGPTCDAQASGLWGGGPRYSHCA